MYLEMFAHALLTNTYEALPTPEPLSDVSALRLFVRIDVSGYTRPKM